MSGWPSNPAEIRVASQLGARPVRPSPFRVALVWLGTVAVDLALWAAILSFFVALYCAN